MLKRESSASDQRAAAPYNGGGPSLKRTPLRSEFRANREKYREISEFHFKSLPEQVFMVLNPREFVAMNLDSLTTPNTELSPTYQGIAFP